MNGDMKELSDNILKVSKEFPHEMSWEKFSEICGLDYPEIPENIEEEKLDPALSDAKIIWSSKRNSIKTRLNEYWIKEKMPYLIFNGKFNVSVLVRERDNAVQTEEFRVFDNISRRMEGIDESFNLLSQINDIRPSTRRACQTIKDGLRGLHMAILGVVPRLGLPVAMRDDLIQKIESRLNMKIDEEE